MKRLRRKFRSCLQLLLAPMKAETNTVAGGGCKLSITMSSVVI